MKVFASIALALVSVALLADTARPITTVILVRHAEKVSDTDIDSPLSDAGHARARELARVLSDTRIDAIYITQYLRTRDTAAPLAKALGVEAQVFTTSKTYAADMATRIRTAHKGQMVLVVGHSNSTVDVLRQLGVSEPRRIEDSQFDHLFIVTLVANEVRAVTLRYGK